ncbi:MAG: TonB-dependent receptor [Clostridium sp.]|nr:TonB-dependent receptor [Clostridium sp.]
MTNTNLKKLCLLVALTAGMPMVSYAEPASAQPAATAPAETADCTGTVVDSDGEPLIGATVRVDGTQNGAATNIDGVFSLKSVKIGSKLTVSYVGYQPQTVVWKGQPLTISMKDDSNVLDEVVVMGYGVAQKRSKVTNSVAKVDEKALTVGVNANPAQALAGAVSGVKVNITSGDPSATPNITVRGGTNWDGSASNPLYVVDGQIRESLADINPNDIESMEILKDAGATALYGARAANGVILISTKKGKSGQGNITLSVKYGITHYDSGYDMVNAHDYIYWMRKAAYATENPNPAVPGTTWLNGFYKHLDNGSQPYSVGKTTITDRDLWNILTLTDENSYLLNHGWQTMPDPLNDVLGTNTTILYKDTDVPNYNMQSSTATQDYNLSFSGANDRGNYYSSLGYYKADGSLPATYYERYNFSFTGGYKISNWLTSNSVFNYTRANYVNTSNNLATGYLYGRINSMPRTLRLENEEGERLYAGSLNGASYNLHYQPEKYVRDNQRDKFQMTQSLTATIIPGLTLKGTMSWYYNELRNSAFNKNIQTNNSGSMNTSHATSESFDRYFDQTYNIVANFNRTFVEKHTVNAMVGMEFYKRTRKGFDAAGQGAPTDDFADLQYTAIGNTRSIDSWKYQEAILSYFGRVEYDYMDKYLFAATFREDGYSRLQNNRWGFFPGVSAGWVFSKENFWANNEKLNFINYAKLRGSFGLNGVVNSNIIGYYTLLGSYSPATYAGLTGFRIGNLPNLNLKWERTRTFDLGLTFGFLNNRFNLDLAYYNRLTMDKYASKALPRTTGFSSVTTNNGSFRNQGLEIDINATLLRTHDFTWTLGANLTYNRNVVVDLPYNGFERNRQDAVQVYDGTVNADGTYGTKYIGGLQEGQEPMHIIGYKKARILQSWDDVNSLGNYVDISRSALSAVPIYATDEGLARLKALGLDGGAVRLSPGDVIWQDANGDNMIDTYDRFDLGNRLPHWTGGFNTTLSWKGLSLYARFDMGFDMTVYDSSFTWWMGGGQGTYSFPVQAMRDTWTPENPNAKYPRYVIASNMGTNAYFRTSDILAESGAYLACRELSLSYQLPQSICNKFRSQGLTLSVTGQNLGYLKKCTLPLPDNTQNLTYADNQGTYNLPLTVIFGLNVTF